MAKWKSLMGRLGLSLAPYTLVVLFALGLPLYIRGHLDLRDVPGPAAMKQVVLLVGDTLRVPILDRLLVPLKALFGGNVIQFAFSLSLFGGVAASMGAAMGGHAVAGRLGALGAGLITAFFSYALLLSSLAGPDPLAWGFAWLGVGFFFLGAYIGWKGLPFLLVGAFLTLLGPEVKESALPVLPLLLVAPLVQVRRPILAIVIGAVALFSIIELPALLRGWAIFNSAGTLGSVSRAMPELSQLPEGLKTVRGMVGVGWRANVFFHLFVLGTLGALIPGPKHLARLALWVGGIAILGLVGIAIGTWTKVRFLMMPSMPFFILSGAAIALITHWFQKFRRLQFMAPLGPVALVAILCFFWFDALDLFHQWSGDRERSTEAIASSLPRSPRAWRSRNHLRQGLMISDFGAMGSIDLTRLAMEGPEGGVLGIRIRDSREAHLVGGAAARGVPYMILTPEGCCPDGLASVDCAVGVVTKANEAGSRLILPRFQADDSRLPPGHQRQWAALLIEAANPTIEDAGTFWSVVEGEGTGEIGVLPCTEGPGAIQIGGRGGAAAIGPPRGPPLPNNSDRNPKEGKPLQPNR